MNPCLIPRKGVIFEDFWGNLWKQMLSFIICTTNPFFRNYFGIKAWFLCKSSSFYILKFPFYFIKKWLIQFCVKSNETNDSPFF